MTTSPLNQILFGPPGTGKTYTTIKAALEIVDPEFFINNPESSREAQKKRFDELSTVGQIRFVTFHQSFSYEDFVEGLRASSENGAILYSVEAGSLQDRRWHINEEAFGKIESYRGILGANE